MEECEGSSLVSYLPAVEASDKGGEEPTWGARGGRMRLARSWAAAGTAAGLLLFIGSLDWQMERQIKVDALHGKTDTTVTEAFSPPCEEGLGLYPEENPGSDRILDQLEFRPCSNVTETKTILLWGGVARWGGVGPRDGGAWHTCTLAQPLVLCT